MSIQTLTDDDRRTLARWALACAERVLPMFDGDEAARAEIRDAVARTRAYGAGESSAAAEIRKRLVGVKAAQAATTPAGAAAARAAGQAAAVAHMGAHALGAAAYAARAVSLADPGRPEAVDDEIRWQLADLRGAEREALRRLPALGADPSGPLGDGLLARGILGSTIRRIQREIGAGRPAGEVGLTGRLVCAGRDEAEIVLRHLPLHTELSRAEPGCLRFEVAATEDPLVWSVSELFADRESFDRHQACVRASEWGRATAGIARDYVVEERS
ncbi:putative quinol monooxygenase [Microbacterium indicum]|uniref:putative quinol monooxygenase n=1 Tax=Microbacterium indicum TaxID=358100 RepID=UPI00316AE453